MLVRRVMPRSARSLIEDLLLGLCENLEEVVVPETVKVICPQAFRECKSLTKIVLPNAVETIGAHCFDGCICLRECNRPTALKQVDGYAFFNTPLVSNTRYIPEQTLIFRDSAAPYVPFSLFDKDESKFDAHCSYCELVVTVAFDKLYGEYNNPLRNDKSWSLTREIKESIQMRRETDPDYGI